MPRPLPSVEYLRQRLDYDPESGALTWKARRGDDPDTKTWNSRFAGRVAGSDRRARHTAYRDVRIDYRRYLAHRIAWKMHYGTEPPAILDHIDGDGLNNAISNLQASDHQNNAMGRRVKTGKDLPLGVSQNRRLYVAVIIVAGERHCLGYFPSVEEAHAARKAAERRLGYGKRGWKPGDQLPLIAS